MGRILVNPVMSLKEKERETKYGTQSKDMRRRFLVTLTHTHTHTHTHSTFSVASLWLRNKTIRHHVKL